MVALRIGKKSKFQSAGSFRNGNEGPAAFSGGGRRVLTLDALPMDVWEQARIEPSISMDVKQITSDGLEVRAMSPLGLGRRLSLGFPDSPFLPRPGTVARVSECVREENGWHVQLTYEPSHAA